MRLIDGDELYQKVVGYNGGAVDKTVAKRLIDQMPTIDAISRQAAIDEVKRLHDVAWANWQETNRPAHTMIYALKDLPSAQPKREKGKWLWKLADNGWANHICSKCGWTKNTDIHVSLGYSFCPNCGADMRGEQNENN